MHDIYRALSVLADECDLVQSEVYRNSPNDPARFVNKTVVTQDGEIADIKMYQLDLEKIAEEENATGCMPSVQIIHESKKSRYTLHKIRI